ncbi:hypothetical protein GCM10020254_82510 [Streptomyces goshikiensis]
MSLITEYSITARPDRRIVEVYDADAYLGDDEALQQSRTQVVAGNGYHLYLHSLQPDIEVQVTIRVWDTPRSPGQTLRARSLSPWNQRRASSSSTSSPSGRRA